VGGWLILGIINVGIRVDAVESIGLTNTLGVFFKAVMWVLIFITFMWVTGFTFEVLKKIQNG